VRHRLDLGTGEGGDGDDEFGLAERAQAPVRRIDRGSMP
jgi:hypothetical protein